MRGWALLFNAAAAFNLAVALPFMAAADRVAAAIGAGGAPLIAVRALGWCIAVFGLSYAWASRDPLRHRAFIQLAVIGKAGIVALVLLHAVAGQVAPLVAGLAVGDLLWVAAFVLFLRRTRA